MCLTVHESFCCAVYLPSLYIKNFSIFAHWETKRGNQLIRKNAVTDNKIFEVVFNRESRLTGHTVNTALRKQYLTSQRAGVTDCVRAHTHTHTHTHTPTVISEYLRNIDLLQTGHKAKKRIPEVINK